MGRLKALEQSCLSAVDVTKERLLTLLKENAETEFGKKHEFSEICSVYDYKRKVPFSVFDDYYAQYRQDGKLGPLELILLQPQTFALYRDIQIWNGASPNQLKPVHVISTPNAEAFFRGLKI